MPNEVQNSNIYRYMKLHATVLIQTISNSYDKTKNFTECEVHCKDSVQIKSLKQLILVPGRMGPSLSAFLLYLCNL